MIKSFNSRALSRFWERGQSGRVNAQHVAKLTRILNALERAQSAGDMDFPGFRLHALTGDMHGYWSVTVNGNWRVIFRIENGHVEDVDYLDYH